MRTKLGLLTSKRTAILHPASTDDREINEQLDRYSEQDLFEVLLMLGYLLLKEGRKEHENYIWITKLKRHEHLIRKRLPEKKNEEMDGKAWF